MAVDPRDFLLNTDYEMDKIVYFKSGSLNAGQYDVDIQHGLSFTPLLFGVCAFNSDFSDARGVPYQMQTMSDSVQFTASANGTNVRVSYINYSGSPSQIYYRLYGFEPSNSSATVPATSGNASQFVLNTDYNYCKLFQKGTASVNSTVNHNLGYIPQVLVWQVANGWTSPVAISDDNASVIITDQSLIFNFPYLGVDSFHYRIYYDEASA